MRISFLLPCSGRYPIGGFRVIYEYANRLTARGHALTLIHVTTSQPSKFSRRRRGRARLQYVRDLITGGYRPEKWFALDPRVKTTWHFAPSPRVFVPGDVVIATAWQTAPWVAEADASAGRKYYFVQGLESWNSSEDELMATWRLPLRKIIVSKWLGEIAAQLSQAFTLVPNAIDTDFFTVRRPIADRPHRSILLQCHRVTSKGTLDAIEALRSLRARGVAFDLTLFGLKRPGELGIDLDHTFVFNPPQAQLRDLYNANAIFVAPSWLEGWGLTPHEAGACGAALAVSDIGGHREFLSPEVSALMSPPQQPDALAGNIGRLLSNPQLRMEIASAAAKDLSAYTWASSTDRFETALAN